ncbi:MAG: DUF1365 family protein [Desulfuromonadaceae bacterium]|nr:DUF1365 family protein [Desulfuromonadaceae bacterium]
MNSCLYDGELRHIRTHKAEHSFVYPLHLYALDLDELERLERDSPWFGHNRIRPLAVHDRDYLYPGEAPLWDKVQRALKENGIDRIPHRVVLVTALRQFHYVFNPVSFFYCFDEKKKIVCVLANVNNTFGESHLYVLKPEGESFFFETDKVFHVSPFFSRQGHYQFHLPPPDEELSIRIIYFIEDRQALEASFSAQAQPLTPAVLVRILLLHPLRAAMTFPRILWQAGRLYLGKKLKIHARPEPSSFLTIRRIPPSMLERLGKKVILRFLGRLDHGRLTVTFPGGESRSFGSPEQFPQASLTVHRDRFFRRAMLAADIGFGESYVDGDWDSPDLVKLLSLLSLREEALNDRRLWPALACRMVHFFSHLRRDNTLSGSRRNISEHYDLSNDLYGLFLDPTMTYSSGIFLDPGDSLEESQRHKFRIIIDKAGIGPGDQVLEIGCGWGGFAVEVVKQTGCRLLGITLSRRQFEWATRRVGEEGLEDRIEIRLADYRHIEGRFTRIVSIEMLEAVGHRHLGGYFAALDRLLAPQGRIVLQTITLPDQKYLPYRFGCDWIRKHIFPGGHLPSLGAITAAMTKGTRLNVTAMEDIGWHYVRTLALWREALLSHRQKVIELGFDEFFLRKWEYYFSYCEAGFRNRLIRNYQLVLGRMGEPES